MQYMETQRLLKQMLLINIYFIHNEFQKKFLEIFRKLSMWTKYLNSVIFLI